MGVDNEVNFDAPVRPFGEKRWEEGGRCGGRAGAGGVAGLHDNAYVVGVRNQYDERTSG